MRAFSANGIVTLTTDFGTGDWFAGAMRGAVLRDFPGARIVDITHEVEPQRVVEGAFVLEQAAPCFPSGTVHVGVIDPGVGSTRRALIVEWRGEHLFVGPDNGLFQLVAEFGSEQCAVWALDRLPVEWSVSSTFHGRDVFARVGAHLAAGAPIATFSSGRIADPVPLPWRDARIVEDGPDRVIEGEVVHVDRFGNLITNVREEMLRALRGLGGDAPLVGRVAVEVAGAAGMRAPLVRTYGDVAVGELLAYVGSARRVEVAIRDGSAASRLGAPPGEPLRVVAI